MANICQMYGKIMRLSPLAKFISTRQIFSSAV
jgi:hypothetical protein